MPFNATAVAAQCHSQQTNSDSLARRHHQCVVFSPQKLIGGLAPVFSVRRWKLHFPRYRLVKVSWKSVQPFPRTVVWYFCDGRKKKQKKNICKRYTHPPHWRLRKWFAVRTVLRTASLHLQRRGTCRLLSCIVICAINVNTVQHRTRLLLRSLRFSRVFAAFATTTSLSSTAIRQSSNNLYLVDISHQQ